MKRISLIGGLLAVLAVAASCSLDPISKGPANTGSISFARFHVVGNSLTAGFQSGGLVEGYQRESFGAMIAQAAGAPTFEAPFVSEPGLPPTLFVASFSPLTIDTLPGAGMPINTSFPGIYNNLGVPGATVHDLLFTRVDPLTPYGLVLRDSVQFGGATVAAQVASARPTLTVVWAGNNDILGSASVGTDALLTPTANFITDFRALMDDLVAASDKVVAANVPDIAAIPFFTTVPPIVVDPTTREPVVVNGQFVPLIGMVQGVAGQLPPGTLVTLPAAGLLGQGIGVPTQLGGTGQPLPDAVVVDPTELAGILARLATFNAVIDSVCANRGVPVADMFGFFNNVAKNGITLGGETFTTEFLSGGLFSVDGVHPSSLGYWFVAKQFIGVMNAAYGASIPDPHLPTGPFRNLGLGMTPNLVAASRMSARDFNGTWRALGVEPPAFAR